MDRLEILNRLSSVFKDVFDDDIEISEQTKSEDIEDWDSLHSLCLYNEIEKKFKIKLSLNETQRMKSVIAICEIIEQKLGW